MSDNEISILEWLVKKLQNPRLWLQRSQQADQPQKGKKEDDSAVEAHDTVLETHDDSSASTSEQVKVALSFEIPLGNSVELNVLTSSNEGKPSASLTSSPELENYRIEVNPPRNAGAARGLPTRYAGLKASLGSININIKFPLIAILVGLSLFLYIFTRFAGLNRFPAFFFSDEAMQSIYAEQLIDNHFISANDKNIPVYVPVEGDRWSPMVTIYIQAATVMLFGKSVLQTRATSIFISFIGVVSVGLILKYIFNQKYWWGAILFLTLLPAWFLHSRTAFETVMATAFYAMFLLFYLLYRYKAPAFLFGAVFFGALTFYSYSNSQALMGVTTLGLIASDFQFHRKNIKIVAWSLLLVVLVAIPFIIFQFKLPGALEAHLRAINSYWYQQISMQEKFLIFFKNYLIGLSPQYWFLANSRDLIRHRMIGYGHIPLWSLPIFLTGLVLALRNFRESSYRAVLIAILAAPVGASMLEISIARTLFFVVPATILAMLGLEWLLGWVERKINPIFVAISVFITFTLLSLFTMNDAVINGPRWTNIYGLYGLQYGAVQIFQDTLPQYVQDQSTRKITVSPVWANATDRFVYFFFTPDEYRDRIFIDGLDTYLMRKQDISSQDLFIWTAEEYARAVDSGKFKTLDVEKIIPYPDGNPGFFVVRMQYADTVDDIFAAEKLARSKPEEAVINLAGQDVQVTYSRIDGGNIANIFDGDPHSLMRSLEANPTIVELVFPEARQLSGLDLTTATMGDFTVTLKLYDDPEGSPVIIEENFKDLPSDPTVSFDFAIEPSTVKKLIIEIKHNTLEDPTHIHIREIHLR